jgi:hypothetical protein
MSKLSKEDLFQPKSRVSRKHTVSSPQKYDPDQHISRREKDEEKLQNLLTDLIKTELKKLFKK